VFGDMVYQASMFLKDVSGVGCGCGCVGDGQVNEHGEANHQGLSEP
jgi:hypothetical protein